LGSLAGIVVGFLLSQVAVYINASRAKKKEKLSIKALLVLELNQNLNLLKDYWHDVSLPPDEDEVKENFTVRLVRRSKEIPYPPLLSLVWEAHISKLPEVLDENDLKNIWHQYEIMRFLPMLHERLIQLDADASTREHGYLRASRALRNQGAVSATFKSESAALMMEYKTLIVESIELGNPLITI